MPALIAPLSDLFAGAGLMAGAPTALIVFASAEPKSARFVVPLLGVCLFAAIVSRGQRRRVPTVPFVALIVLLGFWLFAVGLVWSDRWPSMVRWQSGWPNDTGAWQWDALLALALVSMVATAGSLRAFVLERRALGWGLALLAVGSFAAWSAVVRYAIPLAVVMGTTAFLVLVLGPRLASMEPQQDRLERPSAGASGTGRGLGVAALTVLAMLWVSFALLFFLLREGENVVCHCWADNRYAWQYTAQFILALGGLAGLTTTGMAVVRRRRSRALAAGLISAATLLTWFALVAH